MIQSWLADVVRAAHVLFVLFVLGGLLAIPAGIALKAAWVRNPWFRWPHLAASVFLVVRIWTATPCPLSEMEYALRSGNRTPHWTDVMLFRGMEKSRFSAGVMAQGVMSGLFLIVRPPRRRTIADGTSPA